MSKDISVVIPAYNEAARLGSTLERVSTYLQRKGCEYEIIVVDDGSTDATKSIVESCADKNVFLISYGKNRGKGFAVRMGMLAAKKSRILFSDADLSTPIQELDAFLESDADIVIGSRNLSDSRITKKQPCIRQTLGKAFPAVVETILPLGIRDTQCGFKLFTKKSAHDIFRRLRSHGFGFDVEALYLARKLGYIIDERAVEWHNEGGSKVSIIRDVPKMLIEVGKMYWRGARGFYK